MRIKWKGGLGVDLEGLLAFLNREVPNFERQLEESEGLREAYFALRECVDAILKFKSGWPAWSEHRRRNRAVFLYRQISEKLSAILAECRLTVLPGAAGDGQHPPSRQSESAIAEALAPYGDLVSSRQDSDLKQVFSPGLSLIASPEYGNFALAFLVLISEPKLGIQRLFACVKCGRIQTGRPDQSFCDSKCRSRFNNSQRPPEKNREAVHRYRRELRQAEERLRKRKFD